MLTSCIQTENNKWRQSMKNVGEHLGSKTLSMLLSVAVYVLANYPIKFSFLSADHFNFLRD
jgi:hypothetical protein